jgi:UDP-N-acetyl-2-amino-2-deoxyglucuronate dehydrogenase
MTHHEPVRFAVIGCGRIGSRHAELITQNPHCRLMALVDIKNQSELSVGSYEVPFFSSLGEFLASGIAVDVVNIATPNGLHAEQALALLKAGIHVVIEKPMTLNATDAREVIRTAKEMGRSVFVVMQNRFSPPSKWIKELVSSGRLGKIFFVQLNCFWNRDARYYTRDSWHGKQALDGGTLFTQFSHFIDMMYWLFGDIQNIRSRFLNFNHRQLTEFEDSGMVTFDFNNGGSGTLNFSTSVWDRNLESSMTVIAENGTVQIGGQYMNRVDYCHVKDYTMPSLQKTSAPNHYGSFQGSAQNHAAVISNVVEVIRGASGISTPAEEGLHVVDIIERIYKGA